MHAIVTHVRGKRETHVAPVFTRDEIPSLKVWIRPADHGRSQPLVVMTDFCWLYKSYRFLGPWWAARFEKPNRRWGDAQYLVEVLHDTSTHRYLGRLLVGNLKRRSATEFAHRLQVAGAKISQSTCADKLPYYFSGCIVWFGFTAFGRITNPKNQCCAAPGAPCNRWLGGCGWQCVGECHAQNVHVVEGSFGNLPG